MSLRRAVGLSLALALVLESVASAQPAAPAPAPAPAAATAPAAPAEEVATEAQRRQEARDHFEKGIALSDAGAWAPALAEFLRSRALFPSRGNTKNAALSLRRLNRFDEALDMFEALLREFSDLAPQDKALAQKEVTELRGLVATIEIDGAEPGAAIVIDGRSRADFPLVAPLRVPAGTHTVRVFKEGFEPFEGRIDVAGGQTTRVTAKLTALSASGRLKVVEKSGKVVDVVVDGAVLGQTPWEGLLAVGDHVVLLRGAGNVGTQPALAPVKQREVTSLSLAAEELDASLAIEVTPAGASVALDSVGVGRGIWDGRLRSGEHRVEVTSDGFFPSKTEVTLKAGERRVVKIDLQRDADASLWKSPPKVTLTAGASFLMTPSLGGDVAGGCSGDCARGLGVGLLASLYAGYELGSGLGFGVGGGYLFLQQSIEGRAGRIEPQGLAPVTGDIDDELRLQGGLIGGHVSYHVGERFPTLFRLGVGALLGQVRDTRHARFDAGAFEAPAIGSQQAAAYLHVDPEVRFGVRVVEHLELAASFRALLLFALNQPRWGRDEELPVVLPGSGYAEYADDALTGKVVVLFAPGVTARYDF